MFNISGQKQKKSKRETCSHLESESLVAALSSIL